MCKTVVVTGVGGGGNGEQIVKALRLSDAGYTIVGTDVIPYSKGLYEVDHAYLVPDAKDPRYIEEIARICRHHDAIALISGSEPELRALSAHRRVFADLGVLLPMNLPEVIDLCMDKVRSSDYLVAQGFAVPRWRRVASVDDLDAIDMMPAVLKPSVGGGGSRNLFLAQTRAELDTFGRYLLGLYPEFIVQEYVGTVEAEFTIGVLHTLDGEYVNTIAVRRNLGTAISSHIRVPNISGRTDLGPTLVISSGFSHGDIGRFLEVTSVCRQIARTIDARGAINIQCRVVDGVVRTFEINPRFSGTTSLRAMVGYNEPDLLIRHHVFGEAVTADFAYREGTILRGLSEAYVDPQRMNQVRALAESATAKR